MPYDNVITEWMVAMNVRTEEEGSLRYTAIILEWRLVLIKSTQNLQTLIRAFAVNIQKGRKQDLVDILFSYWLDPKSNRMVHNIALQ